MGVESARVSSFGRLENGLRQASNWYLWGPYVSERQWGTVREDYSADGEAWDYLPHDRARSQAYRWGEDGLAGFCDIEQRLCLGLALWNGRDPILKERAYGLTGAEANHGEDVKEDRWYLDALPSHAWNRWRYHYPQGAFPYEDLREENGRRTKWDPEYELLDTGAFDEDRYWIVEVHYAKADPFDLLMSIQVTNAGPEAETLHVLPTAWFRNTWSWELDAPKPVLAATGEAAIGVQHPFLGDLGSSGGPGSGGIAPTLLFCENETNHGRLYGTSSSPPYPKDGINDHVIGGAATVNPESRGTKCAFWYQLAVESGGTVELRLRLRPLGGTPTASAALGRSFDKVMADRREEADEFYTELTPKAASADEAMVMRQAFAGMLWSKQLYYYDVSRWLAGDPPNHRHRRRGCRAATPDGATSTPSTSCRCRTSGSTRGSLHGILPFTAWPLRTWTRHSPSTSWSFCVGSGSNIQTGPCPPTNGISGMSTLPCRLGPPSRFSLSTVAVTLTFSAGSSTSSS